MTTAEKTQRIPHSLESERLVLGSLITCGIDRRELAGDILGQITSPADFYLPAHGAIFAVLRDLYHDGGLWDLQVVLEKLKDVSDLAMIGGIDFVVALAEETTDTVVGRYHASRVMQQSKRRKLLEAAYEIQRAVADTPESMDDCIDRAEGAIMAVRVLGERKQKLWTMGDMMHETFARMEAASDWVSPGTATGWKDLDEKIGGLHKGEMIVVAARPGMGKTSVGIGLMISMMKRDIPVLFFSMEMKRTDLMDRLISWDAKIPYSWIRRHTLNGFQAMAAKESADQLCRRPGCFYEQSPVGVMEMRSVCRRFMAQHGAIGCVVVDYLQLMGGNDSENRQTEVAGISRGLKAMAMELDLPVVAMCQLNRKSEETASKKPSLSHLRESGAIEQDADVVLLMHHEDYSHRDDPSYCPTNAIDLDIAKNRHGETGVIKLHWVGESMRIENHSTF